MDDDRSLVGCTGVLVVGTRGPAGPGEVLIRVRGGSEAFVAWSDEPLPEGETVLVVESKGTRAVHVVTWSDLAPPEFSG